MMFRGVVAVRKFIKDLSVAFGNTVVQYRRLLKRTLAFVSQQTTFQRTVWPRHDKNGVDERKQRKHHPKRNADVLNGNQRVPDQVYVQRNWSVLFRSLSVVHQRIVEWQTRRVQNNRNVQNYRVDKNHRKEFPSDDPALAATRLLLTHSRLMAPISPPVNTAPAFAVAVADEMEDGARYRERLVISEIDELARRYADDVVALSSYAVFQRGTEEFGYAVKHQRHLQFQNDERAEESYYGREDAYEDEYEVELVVRSGVRLATDVAGSKSVRLAAAIEQPRTVACRTCVVDDVMTHIVAPMTLQLDISHVVDEDVAHCVKATLGRMHHKTVGWNRRHKQVDLSPLALEDVEGENFRVQRQPEQLPAVASRCPNPLRGLETVVHVRISLENRNAIIRKVHLEVNQPGLSVFGKVPECRPRLAEVGNSQETVGRAFVLVRSSWILTRLNR